MNGKKLIKNKKNYSKPILIIHGNVEKITKYTHSGNTSDGHAGGKRFTE